MSEAERESFRKPFLQEHHHVTFAYAVQTIVIFFLLWGMTYANLKVYTPIINPYANLIGLVNGLTYSFFFFARVFVE
jgi:hypothetical protein